MQAKWPKWVLTAAGIYNLAWGAWVVLAPMAWFDWLGVERPNYPQIWQCVGMIVGVYGIGYLLAAGNPLRHWPIVLVGLLGKIFGPIGFLNAALRGELPWSWGATILTNDLIWWIPFAGILLEALRAHSQPQPVPDSRESLMSEVCSQRGATLAQLSARGPVLTIFVRHFGCVFCREALADLAAVRPAIEAEGAQIAIVHQSSLMKATEMLGQYGLDDLHRYSDPSCALYHAFGLSRGRLSQLLGPRIWLRGFLLMLRGHSPGTVDGDVFQMPGAFVIRNGQVVRSFRHDSADDRPDYLAIVQSATRDSQDASLGATPKLKKRTLDLSASAE
jgi:hypothetical protein